MGVGEGRENGECIGREWLDGNSIAGREGRGRMRGRGK